MGTQPVEERMERLLSQLQVSQIVCKYKLIAFPYSLHFRHQSLFNSAQSAEPSDEHLKTIRNVWNEQNRLMLGDAGRK